MSSQVIMIFILLQNVFFCCSYRKTDIDQHFDKCPILKNHDLLKSHYIDFVQLLQQTFNSQKQAETSLNLFCATDLQQQVEATAKILQLVKDTTNKPRVNYQYFPIIKK